MSKIKKQKQVIIEMVDANAIMPKYETPGSVGMDLTTTISEAVTLKPLERYLFPTGLVMVIPEGMEGQIRPRSGNAIKKGITVLNTPGTIDSDYRGEIKVCIVNLSNENVVIEPNDRIAQIVFANTKHVVFKSDVIMGNDKYNTNRGDGGFGSTGFSSNDTDDDLLLGDTSDLLESDCQ